ncbi:uncharacterized protein ARMOST_05384 [Armillaria ostoyae]|uniref:Uncharacterized protein n=1 Tax=Armillaria ostoyae TaxID=47428 RepID=A0A284R012_ARMOS|nr:uncharacterized protein ARMOST_05384 [Armillaria ostoyae]
MAEEKSAEVYFEAMEQLEDRFRVSKLADQVLLRAYGEWSACSWDTRYKSPCNANFTAVALLYLSGQVGLSGLQHCLRLIKTHLTHPDVNDYNFVIPPGVHAPFNAHIVAVTSDVECLHASETGLEGDLYDCAKLLLNKDCLLVTPETFAIRGDLRELRRNQSESTTSEAPDNQGNPIKPLMVEALWMAKRATTDIPSLPSHTLPYLPQILIPTEGIEPPNHLFRVVYKCHGETRHP